MAEPRKRDEGVGVNYKIPRDLHARMAALAEWKGQSLRIWVTRAFESEVERQEAERSEAERKRRSRPT